MGDNNQYLKAIVTADTTDYENNLKRASKVAKDEAGKIEGAFGGSGGGGFLSGALSIAAGNILTSVLTGAVDLLKKAAVAGYEWNVTMERARITFTSIDGDVNKANAEISSLRDLAKSSEFRFSVIEQAAQNMRILGFTAEDTTKALRGIGNATAILHGGEQQFLTIADALARMKEKTRLTTFELRSLLAQGVPVWDILAEATGKSMAAIKKMAAEGRIDSAAAIDIIIDGMNSRFAGGSDAVLKTSSVMMDKIQADLAAKAGTVFKPFYDKLPIPLKTTMDLLGSQTVNGFINGLAGAETKAIDKGLEFAHSFISTVEGAFGIQSPSKVFIEIGHNIIEGFVLGLQDGQQADATAAAFSARLAEAFKKNAPNAKDFAGAIYGAASKYGVPPDLLAALIGQETGGSFKTNLVSRKGAVGLTQFMPDTARQYGLTVNGQQDDRYDADKSILAAAHYLSDLMGHFGDLDKTLAGYNAGQTAVDKYGGVPPYKETQEYVSAIEASYQRLLNMAKQEQIAAGSGFGGASASASATAGSGGSGMVTPYWIAEFLKVIDHVDNSITDFVQDKAPISGSNIQPGGTGWRIPRKTGFDAFSETWASRSGSREDQKALITNGAVHVMIVGSTAAGPAAERPGVNGNPNPPILKPLPGLDKDITSLEAQFGFLQLADKLPGFEQGLKALTPPVNTFAKSLDGANVKGKKLFTDTEAEIARLKISWKGVGDLFENVIGGASANIDKGFKAMMSGIVIDFAKGLAEMADKALAANLRNLIFGSISQNEEGGSGSGGWLSKILGFVIPAVGGALGAGLSANNGFFGTGGTATPKYVHIPGKATGGPVSAGNLYMTGERGKELFVPETNGTIINNDQLNKLGGGKNITVINHFHITSPTGNIAPESQRQAAERMVLAIQKAA